MEWSSIAFVALTALVLVYLVPNRARTRQVLLEARTDDRFSEELRVVAKATPKPAQVAAPAQQRRGQVLGITATEREGTAMRRPHDLDDRAAAVAAERASSQQQWRRMQLARRAAAARRRLVLTAVLLTAAVTGWVGVAAASWLMVAAIVPTALLVVVLILGRRAVVLNARADAAHARRAEQVREMLVRGPDYGGSDSDGLPVGVHRRHGSGLGVVAGGAADGHAQDDSDQTAVAAPALNFRTEPTAVVGAFAGSGIGGEEAPSDETWTPVPVPAPSYTFKPPAPRWQPAPLDLPEPVLTARGVVGETTDAELGAESTEAADDIPVPGLDLDEILARRRAAGA